VTRRAFVAGIATAGLLSSQRRDDGGIPARVADVVLRIERAQIEVAPGRTITTTTYNGTAPGPLIRMREGVPTSVEIINRTEVPEYVHWHGLEILLGPARNSAISAGLGRSHQHQESERPLARTR